MQLEDRKLWQQLDHDPPAPSGVDVIRAMTEGRRRKTRRTVLVCAAAALAAMAMLAVPATLRVWGSTMTATPLDPGPAPSTTQAPAVVLPAGPRPVDSGPAPTNCTVHRLPTPPGVTMALAFAGDPSGHYLVGRTYGGAVSGVMDVVPALWRDGELTSVPMEGGDPALWAVNSAGAAVGSSFLDDTTKAAWLYQDGKLTRLRGDYAEPRAINTAGVIVGQDLRYPVVWRSAQAEPERLSTSLGEAYGIDEDGTIVGTLVGTLGSGRPVVWYPDGSMHPLALPAGVSDARVFDLQSGWAVGHGGKGIATVGLRWNLRTGEVVTFPAMNFANAVSQAGWVVGVDAEGYAVYASDAGTVRLPPLTPPEDSMDNLANAISDDGRTIGGQAVIDDKDRTIVAVWWSCT